MSEVQHTLTPDAHSSIVGGSSAARILGCPGSVDLLARIPDSVKNASSKYADEGTGLHEIMAYLVGEDADLSDTATKAHVAKLFEQYHLEDDRMFDAVIPAMRAFNEFLDELYDEAEKAGFADAEIRILVEKRVAFPDIDGAFGTTDIVIKTPVRTVVWDWKFGAGVLVKAAYVANHTGKNGVETRGLIGNDQLLFYAVGTRNTHSDYFGEGKWPVTLVICQPRIGDGEPDRYDTDTDELDIFHLDLIDAVEEALSGQGQKKIGNYCRFAACKSICPLHLHGPEAAADIASKLGALKDRALTVKDVEAAEVEIIPPNSPIPVVLSYGEAMAMLLDLKEALEPLLKGAAGDAQKFLEDGGEIPGWKLVPKKAGWDSWEDEDAADKFLGRRKVDTTDRRVVKTVTPAVARTLLKAKGDEKGLELLAKYIKPGVSSGHTMAREDDSRPAIETTASSIGKLANKIATLGS